jgi:hypothetical protein
MELARSRLKKALQNLIGLQLEDQSLGELLQRIEPT